MGCAHRPSTTVTTLHTALRLGMLVLCALAAAGTRARAHGQDAAPAAQTCALEPGPVRTVTRILDAETLTLDDGSDVRLIGALAPRAADAGAAPSAWPPEHEAVAALSALTLGKKVKLAFAGRQSDRYGRQLAHVFVLERGQEQWVQGAMLAAGHARAYGWPENSACMSELLAHEALARTRRIGLWANGVYRVKPAAKPGYLATLRGRFELVTGRVVSVSRTKSASYLNFGADWRSDFTVRISSAVLAADPNLAASIAGAAGRTVVARGWLDRRNGPLIDVRDANQLSFDPTVESDTSAAPTASDAPEGASTPPAPVKPEAAPSQTPDDAAAPSKRPAPSGTEPGAMDL